MLIHGWPLSGRSWEPQIGPLVDRRLPCGAYDRRGLGKSSQPWTGYDDDTFAADLHALVEHLDCRTGRSSASRWGGEVARDINNDGQDRVARAVFAAVVPPYLHMSEFVPPIRVLAGIRVRKVEKTDVQHSAALQHSDRRWCTNE